MNWGNIERDIIAARNGCTKAKARQRARAKRAAMTRRENKLFREWVLDQLHSKPKLADDPHEAVMNEDGDMVPRGDRI